MTDKKRGSLSAARVGGIVTLELLDAKTGRLIERLTCKNLYTRSGLAYWLNLPNQTGAPTTKITQIEVGTSVTPVATTDTVLGTIVLAKTIDSIDTTGATGDTPACVYEVQFDEGEANANLTEVGLKLSDATLVTHAHFIQTSVTGATQANPCVVTTSGNPHGFTAGQRVILTGIQGMTELATAGIGGTNHYYVGVPNTNELSLYTDSTLTTTVNSSAFTAWSSGGTQTATRAVEKTASNVLRVLYTRTLTNG